MTIHYRTDSDGNLHQVWAQRQANSCAVASMWMARNKAFQMTMNESEWQMAWRTYRTVVDGLALNAIGPPPAPMSLDPGAHDSNQDTFENMFASFGTFSRQIAEALRNDGMRVDLQSAQTVFNSLNASRIGDSTPAICLFGWWVRNAAGNWVRRGGHFVVVTRVAQSGRLVILNPWGGVLQELANNGRLPQTGYLEEILYISVAV